MIRSRLKPDLIKRTLASAFIFCLGQAAIAQTAPPTIPIGTYTNEFLQVGNVGDSYWVTNNAWGSNGMQPGTASYQYEQYVGRDRTVGPNGEVAFRMKWRWPQGENEVKSFPSILMGSKPGYYSDWAEPGGEKVRLLDNTISKTAPSGETPGSIFPIQLPVPSLKAKWATKHLSTPTGQGQLTFDIWLQSAPDQDFGWVDSSITHEIMIPLENWGNYGGHPGNRNPGWYDHSATIGGKLYHIYATKGSDGALLYNFGELSGKYGRRGWKMIAFVPDVMPVKAGEIDLAGIINYISTRKDVKGNPWATGKEYVVTAELGVEPVVGTGDMVVYDYKVWKGASMTASNSTTTTTPTAPAPVPAPTSTATTSACTYPLWVKGKQYAAGAIVSYGGQLYSANYANPGYTPSVSTYFWATHICGDGTATTAPTAGAPTTTTTACAAPAFNRAYYYAAGSYVMYGSTRYRAKYANPGYDPTISTYFWAKAAC